MADVDLSDIQIRQLTEGDREAAMAVINIATRWYQEFLPAEEYHEPEMTQDNWAKETDRLRWYGAFAPDTLLGVMGLEYVKDVALLRHAYALSGLGGRLPSVFRYSRRSPPVFCHV